MIEPMIRVIGGLLALPGTPESNVSVFVVVTCNSSGVRAFNSSIDGRVAHNETHLTAYVYPDIVRQAILQLVPADGTIIGSIGCGLRQPKPSR